MTQQQYQQFLTDPCTFLNGPGNVRQLKFRRFHTADNSVSRAVTHGGVTSLRYHYSASRVTPIFLQYDATPIPATSALWVDGGAPPPMPAVVVRDRAYYLKWGVDEAYAIELGADAQLFFTAELTGCGILVLAGPQKLIVVHHNIQVPQMPQGFFARLFVSAAAHTQAEAARIVEVRAQALYNLAMDIIATTPGLTECTQLSVAQYTAPTRVFGVRRGGKWRLFVNHPGGGTYHTDLLYQQH